MASQTITSLRLTSFHVAKRYHRHMMAMTEIKAILNPITSGRKTASPRRLMRPLSTIQPRKSEPERAKAMTATQSFK